MSFVIGCAPPSTRRAIRSVSSSVATASRRSSSVAPSFLYSVAVRAGVAANYAFAAGLAALLGLWIVNRHGHHWTVLWTRVLGVAFCLSVVPDFRPLWREHAPAAGERLHVPTLAAAGGAAVVVLAALALAATDPKAENVVLDMFAGV